MWTHGLDWDEGIDGDLTEQVQQWFSELDNLKKSTSASLSATRTGPAETTIHTFLGASKKAFGAVSYVRDAQPRFISLPKLRLVHWWGDEYTKIRTICGVMKDCSTQNFYLLMCNIPLFSFLDTGSRSLLLNNTMSLEIMQLKPITH